MNSQTLTSPTPQVSLDMRGAACPGPIIEARKLLNGMQPGEILRIVTDCTAAIDDIPLWSHAVDVDFLMQVEMPDGSQEYFLRKGRSASG